MEEVKDFMKNMTSRVTEVEQRMVKSEEKIEKVEELQSAVEKFKKENEYLHNKVDQLENYSRRENIRIIGLKEGCENGDPIKFLEKWIHEVFGEQNLPESLQIERAHRIYAPRSTEDERPRPMLVRFLRYQDREKILQLAIERHRQNKPQIQYDGKNISFFPDMTSELRRRRKAFDEVKREIKEKGLRFALLTPATLRVDTAEGRRYFNTPGKVRVFLRECYGEASGSR